MDINAPSTQKTAILLLNTGSPTSPTPKATRSYLRRFLTDKRIIGLSAPLRYFLVYAVIAPMRARTSAYKYASIWRPEGSPLCVESHALAHAMEVESRYIVRCAMRYEKDSTAQILAELREEGVTRIVLLPLYPHYAISSWESAVEHVYEVAKRRYRGVFEITAVDPYFAHSEYIEAFVSSIQEAIKDMGIEYILFSYHGIPLYQVDPYKGDELRDYPWQCGEMTRIAVEQLRRGRIDLPYEISYQSRFGHHEWLSPQTKDRLQILAQEGGIKRVAVVCPSFVCDCLETLEEIGMEASQAFVAAGGEQLLLVPCLGIKAVAPLLSVVSSHLCMNTH